jgi:hypothetical protein
MAPLPATLVLVPPGPAPELASTRTLFDEVLLCSDRLPDHLDLEVPLVSPLGPPPLGAIVAALLVARHDTVVAAEHPAPDLAALMRSRGDVALEEPSRLLPGCYRRPCLRRLERALKHQHGTGTDSLRGLKVEIIGTRP